MIWLRSSSPHLMRPRHDGAALHHSGMIVLFPGYWLHITRAGHFFTGGLN